MSDEDVPSESAPQPESAQAQSAQPESAQPESAPLEGAEPGGGPRLTQQWAQQWAQLRAERRQESTQPVIVTGPSNFSRAQVPWGLDLAAAWAWRFLVIVAAGLLIVWTLGHFAVITLPLVIALLITALSSPVVRWLEKIGVRRSLSALVVVILGIGSVALLLTFAGQQVANGATDLANQVVKGLDQIKNWLREGPLNASDTQINAYIDKAQHALTKYTEDGKLVTHATEVGTAVTHVFAGFFIVLFSTYFFLADGDRIWAWAVRIAPRAARERVDSSGRVAWISLTQFVRATVIVALVDALGVMLVATILRVPFVLAIGVLVFLGAFIPMVGAAVAGTVAVLVALVDQGPYAALFMLLGVIAVQQLEGHVLQPFLMGRFVAIHPLGIIVAIGCGVLVAGVAGALVAVPCAAAINAVVLHLAGGDESDESAPLADDVLPEPPDRPSSGQATD
ncbi:MAG: AI-2E family transporter [Nocardioides sp.]|uniref:AI-2E family transporter n=1 Tax=Nocardioides sp. TaxID=35761 RepID=UPI0039E4D27D